MGCACCVSYQAHNERNFWGYYHINRVYTRGATKALMFMKCLDIIFAASLANQHGSYMSKKLYVSGYLCNLPGKWIWNL